MKVQSIIRIGVGKYVVRAFVDQLESFECAHETEMVVYDNQNLPIMELAKKLLENEKISAVEITNWDNNGVRVER